MSFGWSIRLRVLLTLVILLTASPLVSATDTGTPEPDPGSISEEVQPTEVPPTAVPTTEPEPTAPPALPTEVPATEVPTTVPEPTAIPTDPPTIEPTVASTNDPEPTTTGEPEPTATDSPVTSAANRSSAPEMGALQAETALLALVQQCEDDSRIGDFEFLPIRLDTVLAANTGLNCQQLDPSLSGMITVTPGTGVPPYTVSFSGSEPLVLLGPIPAGDFVVSITIGEHTGTSATLTLAPEVPTILPITYFVAESAPEVPDDGFGSIAVSQLLCEDTARAGTTHFLVDSLLSTQSTTTNCVPAPDTASGGFVLIDPDNENWVVGPLLPVNGVTRFDTVPSGRYQLIDYGTRSTSDSFPLSGGATVSILAVTYVQQLPGTSTDVFIEKIWCEDNDRAGQTEFTLDTPPAFGPMAASATCFAEPPFLERPELTVTIDGVDVEYSDRTTLNFGEARFENIPAGTYTVTESGDSVGTVTSDPMYISGPETPRVRIINYVKETERPGPGDEGLGSVAGFVLYCSAPDREDGDVDFIIGQMVRPAAAVTECEVVPNATASFVLYEVDEDTQAIVPDSGIPTQTDNDADFLFANLTTGTYALAHVSPATGEEVVSRPFVVQPNTETFIEVNIFSAPVYLGYVQVYKDFCVDPDRAGEASFSVISEFGGWGPGPQLTASAATDCRYSDETDGSFTWTLTNVDTGTTWMSDDTEPWFENLMAGTYTLTETWNGTTHTSEPFSFDPSRENLVVSVRNYIAEHDWNPGEEVDRPYLDLWAYICANPHRDGGAEFFVFGDPNEQTGTGEAVENETSRCRPAIASDGLTFVATPQDGEGEPITFIAWGDGWFEADTPSGDVPAGEYIVTETTTGTTTGLIRVTSDTYVEFYRYQPLPRAEVTVNVSSAAPDIANTLPADATWAISQNGTELISDTFAAEHLALPQAIPVTNPVPHGTFDITVSAGPAFQPYAMSFTVDEPVEEVDIVLIPVEIETEYVEFSITSADLNIADHMPEGSTWTVTSIANPALTMSGIFAPEHLQLPVTIAVENPIPHGQYEVTINAGPVFEPYTEIFTVGGDGDDAVTSSVTRQGFFALQQAPTTFEIVLQPAPVEPTPSPSPTPDPTVTPDPTATPDPTVSPSPTVTPNPTGTPDSDPTEPVTPDDPTGQPTETLAPGTTVSSLPNTGQGSGTSASAAALLVITATAAVVAAIGGTLIRRERA